MKKITYSSFIAILLLVGCKSKKAVTGSTEPTPQQLSAVQGKIPSTTMEDLKKGHDIFYGIQCTKCHSPKNVTGEEEQKLEKVINKMADKAKLLPEERTAVWKYALAVNLAAKK